MTIYTTLAQIIIAASVAYVWIFRFENIIKEFQLFQLSVVIRSFVGTAKTALATLLVVGIWYPNLLLIPSILMGLFMLSAQYFHFKVKNPFLKHLPSLLLLVLCIYLTIISLNTI